MAISRDEQIQAGMDRIAHAALSRVNLRRGGFVRQLLHRSLSLARRRGMVSTKTMPYLRGVEVVAEGTGYCAIIGRRSRTIARW